MLSIVLLLLLIALGLPIGMSFALGGIVYLTLTGSNSGVMLAQASFGGIDSFTILSLPFFMFAGDIMRYGGVSKRLVGFAKRCFRTSISALGNITVLACAFFGAVSGSSAATVSAIGGIMGPEMRRNHYKSEYAAGLISAAGFLGILIPPSVPVVIYACAAGASVGKLFLAIVGPGVLTTVVFILLNRFLVRSNYDFESADAQTEEAVDEPSFLRALLEAVPAFLMPVIILGGIYSGKFTATEASAIAIVYGLFVSLFVYREITFRDILPIAKESALTAAKILLIMATATFFGRIMSLLSLPQTIAGAITSFSSNKYVLLLLINVVLLILGMLMETGAAILLVTPILYPLAMAIGLDPVHFGVIMTYNLAVGLITPPMALNLFVGSQVSGLPVAKIVKPVIPFLIASLVIMVIVSFAPGLSMFLPNLLY
ncbi:TRAP transporter large permease [Butyricicoccus sp. 1XD8-22]|nr:TRAP transporter large permease [Butyricicoccus sp. 1XD8-22]